MGEGEGGDGGRGFPSKSKTLAAAALLTFGKPTQGMKLDPN